MKATARLTATFAALLSLWGCAGEQADGASADESAAAVTQAPAARALPSLASCASRPVKPVDSKGDCEKAVVLRALFSSPLTLTFDGKEIGLASEKVASFITWDTVKGGRDSFAIEITPKGGAKFAVSISMTEGDSSGESAQSFSFTLDGDKVVEKTVPFQQFD
jgi:hypothetical protein